MEKKRQNNNNTLKAQVSFYNPIQTSDGSRILGIDIPIDKTKFNNDNTELRNDILEYVADEINNEFGCNIDYDEFVITNFGKLIKSLSQ